jgi:hypothetical protein
MKTLSKALNMLANAAKTLTPEPQAIEDAIGKMQPGDELRIPINAASVAAGLMNDSETVDVIRMPVIGLAFMGDDEHVGDSLITSLVAFLVSIGAEPAVFPASMKELPGLADIAADDELDALVTIGGGSEKIIDLIKEAGGKTIFTSISAEPLQGAAAGKINGKPILSLPDDPGLSLAAALTLLEPMATSFYDIPRQVEIRAELISDKTFSSDPELSRLIPAELRWKNGVPQVRAVREDDLLTALQKANGWLLLPPASPSVTLNDIVDFLPLRRL